MDETQLNELYLLLNQNFVENEDFRFDYTMDFLKWALSPPGAHNNLLFGIRNSTTKKLIGFISSVPVKIRTKSVVTKMVEISFLCVHKKLR